MEEAPVKLHEAYLQLINEQRQLICDQKSLIDYLREVATAKNHHLLHQTRLRFVLVPSVIVVLLLVLTTTLVIVKGISDKTFTFSPVNPNTSVYIDGYPGYFRDNWGGAQQTGTPPPNLIPSPLIIISHTASETCSSFVECANITQSVQYKDLKAGQQDIGYNFLIGGEGGVYVGRGWERQNLLRVDSVTIAFIGDFNKDVVGVAAIGAGQALIAEGEKLGMISLDYKLVGENQTSPLRFYSPGRNLFSVIKNWNNYFPGTVL